VNVRLNNVLFLLAVLVGLQGAQGQTATGSGLPSGIYVFREFDMSISQATAYLPTYATSGTIVFNSRSGTYTMTGTQTISTLTTIQTVPFSASGTWSYGDGMICITDQVSGAAPSDATVLISFNRPPGRSISYALTEPLGAPWYVAVSLAA
jgi:hypothetical protein